MACDTPYYIKNPRFTGLGSSDRNIPVPCGKCPACLSRRASMWSFRLLHESRYHDFALFVTLTYNPEHVPKMHRPAGTGLMSLVRKDFQDFVKRLRYYTPKAKIKYYAAGEYGSQTMRPHYHAIIFGVTREEVDKAWTAGSVWYGDVEGASVAYTCKYINKGKIVPVHKNDDRVPEFSLMSKGLGKGYLTPAMVQYHKADITRNYVTLDGGVKAALPRYFREKIYNDDERMLQAHFIQEQSNDREKLRYQAYVEKYGSGENYIRDTYESKKAHLSNFKRAQRDLRNKI